jgi:hypothetical protein
MMKTWRSIWFTAMSALLFFGAAFVTLRAATGPANGASMVTVASPAPPVGTSNAVPPVTHPPPSAAEESATITDDPTIAPDPAESADHSVSFPADI